MSCIALSAFGLRISLAINLFTIPPGALEGIEGGGNALDKAEKMITSNTKNNECIYKGYKQS